MQGNLGGQRGAQGGGQGEAEGLCVVVVGWVGVGDPLGGLLGGVAGTQPLLHELKGGDVDAGVRPDANLLTWWFWAAGVYVPSDLCAGATIGNTG